MHAARQHLALVFTLLLLLTACEKVNLDDYLASSDGKESTDTGDRYTVTFSIDNYTVTDFDGNSTYSSSDSRAVVPASELGTRLNLAIYQDGERIERVNQESSNSNFGTVAVALSEGEYEFAILVHSGTGNATTTNAEKITFTNNKVTDTFTAYRDGVQVTENTAFDISLTRRVAMYRFIVEGAIPDEVQQMQFYYTGGSSTLNVVTGFGCVDSRQTEVRDVLAHDTGQVFETYTFPHNTTGTLKMVVSALCSDGSVYHTVTYDGVPIELNKITIHSTDFFSTPSGTVETNAGTSFTISANNDWDGTLTY